MVVLYGHGYVGKAIAEELDCQGIRYIWAHHKVVAFPWYTEMIINAAGFTGVPNVDACEKEKQKTIEGNVEFPLHLENCGFPVLHITSGCVYTGYKDGGWTEEDEPNFNFDNGSFYSGTKALFQTLSNKNRNYLFRIRMPFSDKQDNKNILTKVENFSKVIDKDNSFTRLEDLAKVVCHFVKNKPAFGIYNVCNPGSSNLKKISEMMGLEREVFSDDDFSKVVVAPRSNCVLNTDKLTSIYPMPTIDEALKETIKNYYGQEN